MNPDADRARRRLEGSAERAEERLPTYQELIDEAVELTFPASDPPATSAGSHTGRALSTPKDERDWALEPDRAASVPSSRRGKAASG